MMSYDLRKIEETESQKTNAQKIVRLTQEILSQTDKKQNAGFCIKRLTEFLEKMGGALENNNFEKITDFRNYSIKISGERSALKILGGLGLALAGALLIGARITLAVTGSIFSHGFAAPFSIHTGSLIAAGGTVYLAGGIGLFKSGIQKSPSNTVKELSDALNLTF